MRWFWIDHFVEFQSGSRAVAIKNVTISEEQLDEYLPSFPVMPNSLIIEGLAQTGGLLVGEQTDFKARVVLAKVTKATFHRPARAGETLRYTAVPQNIHAHGAICHGMVHSGDEIQAEVDLMFGILDDRFEGVDMFEPADFLRMLRTFRLFEIGRTADGDPLPIPRYLLEAEEASNANATST